MTSPAPFGARTSEDPDRYAHFALVAGRRSSPASSRQESHRRSRNEVLVSAATVWEIAIKRAARRLDAPDDLLDAISANSFDTLSISATHALAAGQLPPHHSDPFDRMLIAQARTEALTLVTVDQRFSTYDIDLLDLN